MSAEEKTEKYDFVYKTPPARSRTGCGCVGRLLLLGSLLIALIIFGGMVAVSALVYSDLSAEIEEGIVALDKARNRETFETTQILDRNGELLWEIFGEGKRTRIPLAKIPDEVIKATIATEDDTFYENIGVDAPSLVAAIIANLRNPDDRPKGASTITQQIVSHIVFDYEERTSVSYSRKMKEAILAWIMNRKYTKDEVLEMYLNEIYYGNLAYGIEAAAQTYFGKPAVSLNLAESTLLAGLPQSPVDLDPYKDLEQAKQRQWLVLNLMVNEGFISRNQAESAYLADINLIPQEVSLEAPHFAVYARQLLEEQFGPEVVANGGLKVKTSLDLRYQHLAEILARQHVSAVGPEHNLTNAALVALKPGTGEILAMLGSLDYQEEAIDGNVNVTLSPQQPGSAIKPLTYAAALSPLPGGGDPAWTAADILWDVPVDYKQYDATTYSPVNYDRRFHGPVRLRDALANSYNVPAVLTLQDIGVDTLLDLATRMGIQSLYGDPNRYGLSLTLGGGEVTPLELTAAYAIFANGGVRIPPIAILKVEDSRGQVLFEYEVPAPESVLDSRVAFLISDILDDDLARIPAMGRENPLDLPFPSAAKTGTSNDFRDNWTVGYTPGLVVGVWSGNTDNSEMLNISGLTGAAPLWSAYMQGIYSDLELLRVLNAGDAQPPQAFTTPPGIERREICDLGSISNGSISCDFNDSEWFLVSDSEPETLDPAEVIWSEIDPGVWVVPAVALPPLTEEAVLAIALTDQEQTLLVPDHCYFPEGVKNEILPPEASETLFLAPPRNPESMEAAYEWAQEHDLPLFPAYSCSEDLLAVARDPNVTAIWRITSPKGNDPVSGVTPIIGTADFDPQKVHYYKVELGMGELDNPQWVTLGEISTKPVVNGTLEMLHADALAPGDYLLRLIVVQWDGNYVGEPYTIPLKIQ